MYPRGISFTNSLHPVFICTSHYLYKYSYVAPKYLKKFTFDKIIELEVPESIADFIEGQVPKRIGAKHYMALARQAGMFYPKYVEYITLLKGKSCSREFSRRFFLMYMKLNSLLKLN